MCLSQKTTIYSGITHQHTTTYCVYNPIKGEFYWVGKEGLNNMTDIEILAVEKIVTVYGFSWDIFWEHCLCLTFIFFAMTVVFLYIILGNWSFLFGCIVGLLISVPLAYTTANDVVPLEYEYHYKVIIDDSISMEEFNNYYQVIDKEGLIYTIKEK